MSPPPDDPRPDPRLRRVGEACLARQMRQAGRLLTALYEEVLAPHGLKASQFSLLVAVGAMGTASPGRLSEALDMEKSTVSRGADRLCAAGLLAREPEPGGRGIRYTLTAEGRTRLEGALPDWRRVQKRVKRRLGEVGVEALRDMVSALGSR